MTTGRPADPLDPRRSPAGASPLTRRAEPVRRSEPSRRGERTGRPDAGTPRQATYRPLEDPYPGGERSGRDRPAVGRPRVPNRPQPARARTTGERRPAPGRPRERAAAEPLVDPSRTRGAGTPTRSTRVDPGPARQAMRAEQVRPVRTPRPKAAASHRGRRTKRSGARVNTKLRTRGALVVVLVVLAIALGKLVAIQTVDGSGLVARSMAQKLKNLVIHAQRGSIEDRTGAPLAFTISGKAIAARPANFRNDTERETVATILVAALGTKVDRAKLLTQLRDTAHPYVFLAHGVMPDMADTIMDQVTPVLTDPKVFTGAADTLDPKTNKVDPDRLAAAQKKLLNAVVTEDEDIRTQPDGALAAAVVGTTDRNGVGLAGIESKFNALLKGTDGSRTLQVDNNGIVIPDTVTNVVPATDGTDIRLTIDRDLQFTVQNDLAAQVIASQAKGGCAVVKGISDGQIYAMACYEPGKSAAQIGNPAVTTPFEPGSVNKVVTFAAALERGIIKPTTELTVPGHITIGGRDIHDDWGEHAPAKMTATGVLAKSSNVGTLMIAQKVGATPFSQELAKYGLGKKTGIELPGESAGYYPAQSQWSATSFANLPIGQGINMTMVQLVDMYQAIGNKGVLVSPTVIAGTSKDGVYTPAKPRPTSIVMKPSTAATLLAMLRGTVQAGDHYHKGTGTAAAIDGYQVAGKTGTAQKVNQQTKAYSDTLVTATFGGVVPADNPRFAVAIMIDEPVGGSEGGTTAAPLFHKIASYELRALDVPPSPTAAPIYDLYLQ